MRAWAAFGAVVGAAVSAQTAEPVDVDQVRAIVAEAMHDAMARTSLAMETAGYDGRFFIESADGDYRLAIHGFTQFRYTANWADAPPGSSDFTGGFSIVRSRLFFDGKLPENLTYRIRLGFSSSSGNATLEQAYFNVPLPDQWSLRAGQFALALFRDDWIEAARQLAVNSSAVNTLFGPGQSQGLMASRVWDEVRMWGAFTNGLRTENTTFDGNNADAALTGRIEWKPIGAWSQFDNYSSPRGADFALMVGLAAHWETQRPLLANLVTDQLLYGTGDISLEGDGWNFFLAGVYTYREGHLPGSTQEIEPQNAGLIVQGGFFVTDHIELFARYDYAWGDGNAEVPSDISTYTAGFNYYLFPGSQALKFSFDVLYAPDSVNGTSLQNNNAVGLVTSDGEQWVVQAQLQVMY